MTSRILIITGILATLFAVVLNLAPGATADDTRTLAMASVMAGLIALSVAVVAVRKGKTWRWFAVGVGGPALFALTDAGIRLIMTSIA